MFPLFRDKPVITKPRRYFCISAPLNDVPISICKVNNVNVMFNGMSLGVCSTGAILLIIKRYSLVHSRE